MIWNNAPWHLLKYIFWVAIFFIKVWIFHVFIIFIYHYNSWAQYFFQYFNNFQQKNILAKHNNIYLLQCNSYGHIHSSTWAGLQRNIFSTFFFNKKKKVEKIFRNSSASKHPLLDETSAIACIAYNS